MYCPKCGSELREGSIFCHNCGHKIRITNLKNNDIASSVQEIKDTVSTVASSLADSAKTASNKVSNITDGKAQAFAGKAKETFSNVSDSMKNLEKKVNEATDGQAQAFAGKAKEAVRDFTNDVQQTTKDKDIKHFFTKNRYRNTIIILCLAVLIILCRNVFGIGFSTSTSEAKKIIMADIRERWSSKDTEIEEFYKLGKIRGNDYYAVHYTIDWAGRADAVENRYCYFVLDKNKIVVKYEGMHNMKHVEECFNIVKSEAEKK